MKYNEALVALLLDSYWELAQGLMPDELKTSIAKYHDDASYTRALEYKADIDLAMRRLGRHWKGYDDVEVLKRDFPRLSRIQKALVRHHFTAEGAFGRELRLAAWGRWLLVRYLNRGLAKAG